VEDATSQGTTHDLLLALAGRVDDDLLSWARELVALGEDARAVEMIRASLAAARAVLPVPVRHALAATARSARTDLSPPAALPAPLADDDTEHRFRTPDDDDPVAAALLDLPDRPLAGCRVLLARRLTPAGTAPGPLPHPVVLVQMPAGSRPAEVLAYQLAAALERAGTPASVEVLTADGPLPDYHAAALDRAIVLRSEASDDGPWIQIPSTAGDDAHADDAGVTAVLPTTPALSAPRPAQVPDPAPEERHPLAPARSVEVPTEQRRFDEPSPRGRTPEPLPQHPPEERPAEPFNRRPPLPPSPEPEPIGRPPFFHSPQDSEPVDRPLFHAQQDSDSEATRRLRAKPAAVHRPSDRMAEVDSHHDSPNSAYDDAYGDSYSRSSYGDSSHADAHGDAYDGVHNVHAENGPADAVSDGRDAVGPPPEEDAPGEPPVPPHPLAPPRPQPLRDEARPAPRPVPASAPTPVPAPAARPRPTVTPISRAPIPAPIPLVRRDGPNPVPRPVTDSHPGVRRGEDDRDAEPPETEPAPMTTPRPVRTPDANRERVETPAFESLSDPFNGPLNQPLLDPLLDPTTHDEDQPGFGPQPQVPANEPEPAADDDWSEEWQSGRWAMAPSVLDEQDRSSDSTGNEEAEAFEPVGRPSPRPAPRHRYAGEQLAPDAPGPHERPDDRTHDRTHDRDGAGGNDGDWEEAGEREGAGAERSARLSDADRQLLARLQSELLEGRKPRIGRRPGVSHGAGTTNGNNRSSPPDLAG
jgi:hypothetical protein